MANLNEGALFAQLLNSNNNSAVYKQVISRAAKDV